MQTVKLLTKKDKIVMDDYTNPETGNTILDDSNGGIAYMENGNGKFQIDSDNYVVFSSEAVDYLIKELSRVEVSRVFQMGKMLSGECSVVCQDNYKPHTPETLAKVLEIEKSKFYSMVRKLVGKNILSYCVCSPAGYLQKIYLLNPYIARKRRNLSCELMTLFRDVTQDKNEKKDNSKTYSKKEPFSFNKGEDETVDTSDIEEQIKQKK